MSPSGDAISHLENSRCTHLSVDGLCCVVCSHSWDVVHTYKVQFSNDSLVWKSYMNGTEEAVSGCVYD